MKRGVSAMTKASQKSYERNVKLIVGQNQPLSVHDAEREIRRLCRCVEKVSAGVSSPKRRGPMTLESRDSPQPYMHDCLTPMQWVSHEWLEEKLESAEEVFLVFEIVPIEMAGYKLSSGVAAEINQRAIRGGRDHYMTPAGRSVWCYAYSHEGEEFGWDQD